MIFKRREKRPFSKDVVKLLNKQTSDLAFKLEALINSTYASAKDKHKFLEDALYESLADAAEAGWDDAPADTRSEIEKKLGTVYAPFTTFTSSVKYAPKEETPEVKKHAKSK